MTKNGWCRTNYHSDGKRRYGSLINGLCNECCCISTEKNNASAKVRLQQKINDLETERDRINLEIKRLRSKLQTLTKLEKTNHGK